MTRTPGPASEVVLLLDEIDRRLDQLRDLEEQFACDLNPDVTDPNVRGCLKAILTAAAEYGYRVSDSEAEAIMARLPRPAVRAPRIMGEVYRWMLEAMAARVEGSSNPRPT